MKMPQYNRETDPKTKQFLPIPKGEKPPKMKIMEKELGVNFEDDYREKYLNGDFGQKRFATRWRVKKSQIFSRSMRGGRRSWIQMLDLSLKSQKLFHLLSLLFY